ncbi:MAG: TIGR02206 family membrane protein, partial [Solirubrobacteraceae bacterium]
MKLLAAEHVAVLALTAALAVLVVRRARAVPAWGVAVSRALAVLILAAFVTDHIAAAALGEWTLRRYLPLHLSDVAVLVAVAALWEPRPPLVELTYFWGLTAALQATLTPDIGHGFPSILFFTFFITHAGVVIAALLLVAGRRLAPGDTAAAVDAGVGYVPEDRAH